MKRYLLLVTCVLVAIGASWLLPGATGRGFGSLVAQQPTT